MKNQAHGVAQVYVLIDTDMNEETFQTKFHSENIVDVKLQVTLSDGSVHMMGLSDLLGLQWDEFINNKEENESLVENKKVTESRLDDQIAI